MDIVKNREFGTLITRLIQKKALSRDEAKAAFTDILNNTVTDMQQGAFLAALNAKGETAEEVAGAWEAIFELDTNRIQINGMEPIVENSGTGMDTFKTFNISTAASLIAASGGVKLARHGARAITSKCGTVDMAEALGVDVECSVDRVAQSIEKTNIGLFNGMSPKVHPMALGRILSQIYFGSTLNIAASLANPAMPRRAVRGVYAKQMILPVVNVMKAIGFERALVLHGGIEGTDKGMDEASVCGNTWCAELKEDGTIDTYSFTPESLGISLHDCTAIAPDDDISKEPSRFVSLMQGKEGGAREDAALLNAALIFYISENVPTIEKGVQKAADLLSDGAPLETLQAWVSHQNDDTAKGQETLARLMG